MKTKEFKVVPAHDDYLELVRKFPLRRLRSVAEHDAAMKVIEPLAVRGEDDLSEGEAEYLEALSTMVDAYNDETLPAEEPIPPLVMLRELMEQRGMTVTDLGELFNSKGVASEILNGKRTLTLKRMEKLAKHFGIDVADLMRG